MKRVYILCLFLLASGLCFGQKNLTLLSHDSTFAPGVTIAGVWHYKDTTLGYEYALVGTSNGLTVIDITDPTTPVYIFEVPDTVGLWREVKVWSHYAYMSNEGGHNGGGGISVIDLSYLPDFLLYKKYTGDSIIAGQLSRAHTVEIDSSGYLYINGPRTPDGHDLLKAGTIICSLADPWNPTYVGADTIAYSHDCFVRGNTMIASQIIANPSGFMIFDISDRSNPVPISFTQTPSSFNHNSWMSDDSRYLFTTDEKPRAPVASYDISDFQNVSGPLDLYLTDKNPVGEVHNVHVLNNFIINACYGDSAHTGSQITIVDATYPDNLIEVGNYQLCPAAPGFMISWDADPYLPSGNLIATEGNHGLYVFAPSYVRACYLVGIVTDSLTDVPLNNVKVEILSTPAADSTKFTGIYKTGVADAGTYSVRFSKAGYVTKIITGVVLTNGILDSVNTNLWNGAVGVAEQSAPGLIHIYPNPANEDVTVTIDPSLVSHRLSLQMIDGAGRIVREQATINQGEIKLNRKGIAAGTYTIQISDKAQKVATLNLILQ